MQASFEDLADVFGMERHVEALLDEACDPVGRPQFVVPAVGFGSLEQQFLQLAELVRRQTRFGAGSRFGLQAVGLSGETAPAVDRGGPDA